MSVRKNVSKENYYKTISPYGRLFVGAMEAAAFESNSAVGIFEHSQKC